MQAYVPYPGQDPRAGIRPSFLAERRCVFVLPLLAAFVCVARCLSTVITLGIQASQGPMQHNRVHATWAVPIYMHRTSEPEQKKCAPFIYSSSAHCMAEPLSQRDGGEQEQDCRIEDSGC